MFGLVVLLLSLSFLKFLRPHKRKQDEVEHRRFAVHPFTLLGNDEFDVAARFPPAVASVAATASIAVPLSPTARRAASETGGALSHKPSLAVAALVQKLPHFRGGAKGPETEAALGTAQALERAEQAPSSDDEAEAAASDDGYSTVRCAVRLRCTGYLVAGDRRAIAVYLVTVA